MSRNRKSSSRKSPVRAKSKGGTVVGIFIGLILGALIAAGTAWYFTRANPFQPMQPVASRIPTGDQPPVALPGKPGDQPVVKPDFEFYKILPQGETPPPAGGPDTPVVNPVAVVPPPTVTPPPATDNAGRQGQTLYLQVGAFESPAEAEHLKAQLALAGIESSAQRTQLADGRVMFRVRVGPYTKPEEMGGMRSRLAQAGFNPTVARAP